MTNDSKRTPSPTATGENEAVWYLGTLMIRKAAAETTGGAFEVIEQLAALGVSPLWHVHQREDEYFYVLEGRVTYYVGDQVIAAEPGVLVRLPKGVAHTFRVEGTEPARLLEIVSPAGLWGFFQEMGEPARELILPHMQPPDAAKLRSIATRYGIEMLGPLEG